MRLPALLISVVLLQAPPSASSPQQTLLKGNIEGVVLSVGSDQPVAGAEVRLIPPRFPLQDFPSVPSVTTDRQGRFTFANLDSDVYGILATATGYAPQEYGSRVAGQTGQGLAKALELAPGASMKNLVLHLTPSGAASGRVVVDGKPTAGIEVRLVQPAYHASGRRNARSGGATLTDDRGEYRIYGVTPGKYYVIAGPPDYDTLRNVRGGAAQQAVIAAGRRYPRTFYPSTTDREKASLVTIGGSTETKDLNLTVFPQQLYRIRGRVLDPTGQALAERVTISWYIRDALYGPSGSGSNNTVDAKSDGTFEITNLAPAKYWLEVKVRPAAPQRGARQPGLDQAAQLAAAIARQQPISQAVVKTEVVASDVDNVIVRMTPAVTVRGRITLAGQPLTREPGLERVVVTAMPVSIVGGIMLISSPPAAPPQADGTFLFQRVAPAEYQLRVENLPPDFYVKRATLGSLDVLSEGLRIPETSSDSLEIELSANPGRIEGDVRDARGNPIDNVRAVLIPEMPNRVDLYRVANTDEKGNFAIRGVPPGDYRVFAWESADANAYFDPNFVRPFLDRGTRVRVAESSTATVKIATISPEN